MGLGIGVADAALVPLLASLVDRNGNYGPVYSIQQVAVSLAYSLGKTFSDRKIKIDCINRTRENIFLENRSIK